jgi:hypothetical protein
MWACDTIAGRQGGTLTEIAHLADPVARWALGLDIAKAFPCKVKGLGEPSPVGLAANERSGIAGMGHGLPLSHADTIDNGEQDGLSCLREIGHGTDSVAGVNDRNVAGVGTGAPPTPASGATRAPLHPRHRRTSKTKANENGIANRLRSPQKSASAPPCPNVGCGQDCAVTFAHDRSAGAHNCTRH